MLIKKHSNGPRVLDRPHSASASRFVLLPESSEDLRYSQTLPSPRPIRRQQSKTNDFRPYSGADRAAACAPLA